MQDFIDMYKETFSIDVDTKVEYDTSLSEGDVEVSKDGYKLNANKDADVLEILGKIKLHTLVKDERIFKPTTSFMATIVLGHIYGTMSKHLEVLEMDLLLEKLLIKKEDSPIDSYAVLKVLEADPVLTGADSTMLDNYLSLELNSELLDQIENIEKEEN